MRATRKGRFGALLYFWIGLAVIAAPVNAEAQGQPKIGVTLAGSPPDRFADAFRRGLAEHGWIEGRNINIDYRYAEGRTERYTAFMHDFVNARVDVIVAGGGTIAQRAAQKATRDIPIVAPAGDPLRSGLVSSLARPGGNVTGLSIMIADMSGKRVELLKEAFPKVTRLAYLLDPNLDVGQRHATEKAAQALGLKLQVIHVSSREQFEQAFDQAAKGRAEAILVSTSAFLNANRKRLIELAERHRLLGFYDNREYVQAGGLMSYGVDIGELYRVSAKYVDKILKGAKPGDLPIEQPTKFELIVNARAARRLGAEVSRTFLTRADQVLE